jgi:uridine phosphorylase
MDFFSRDLQSVVNPSEMVRAFTRQKAKSLEALFLESLALITFSSQDLHGLVQSIQQASPIEAWSNRNPRIYRGEGWIAAQAPYGAPGTIMLLEELVAFGVRRTVLLGYCGAIQKKISIGDVVLPMEAIREEGTSYHYLPEGEKSCPDPTIQKKLSNWTAMTDLSFHEGTIWTTDAPYRETPEKIRRYRSEGVLGVEMEMAAVFAFGKARGISAGAMLLVSDEIREEGWRIGFFSPQVNTARKRAIEILIHHIPEMISQ